MKTNAAEAELEGKAGNYTRENNTQTPAFGRVKQPENPIKKRKDREREKKKKRMKGKSVIKK